MLVFSFILILSSAQALERRMIYSKNPGCEEYNMSLHHLRAEGPNDTLHYLWDFTGRPTLFLALTDVEVSLNIACVFFVDGAKNSWNFTSNPKYEFFLIIDKLIEFNDVNDTGIITAETSKIFYDTKHFSWKETEDAKTDDHGRVVSLTLTGTNFHDPENSISGNFTIQLTAFGLENHDSKLPRLLHSPNSTQCNIILENLVSNSGFNKSRFAIEFVLVSSDNQSSTSKISTRKTLDDENSPGIFSIVDLMTPKAQSQKFLGAFLQWRPIIYTSKVHSLSNSSETVAYNLSDVMNLEEVLYRSLPYMYYGDDVHSVLVQQTVVSLGTSQDGFYKNTNYSSWTFLVNYGSPEEEKFSLLVILVMCIGLGLPAVLIFTGGTYMCARRIRRSKDELSLER